MKGNKSRKIGKAGFGVLIAIGLVAAVGVSVLMTYYVGYDTTADADVILEYSADNSTFENAETLGKTFDVEDDFCGADIETHPFWIKCNGDLDAQLAVNWTITDTSTDDPEGLTLQLQKKDGAVWVDVMSWVMTDGGTITQLYDFDAGDVDELQIVITGDDYLMEGTYSFDLDLEASSKL